LLFGHIWSTPEGVIRETNLPMTAIEQMCTGQVNQNLKNPIFALVCIPFGYLDKYFHIFRILTETVVNISKQVSNCDHHFLNCERRQIYTNIKFRHMMTLHEVYVGEYFQNFSS
jgi:hypothetical protein